MNNLKIGAIIVLFYPDMNITLKALRALAPQVQEICIIDNTPIVDFREELSTISNLHYIPLKKNRGIAAAQNIGIKYFIKHQFQFVLFSDQDSITTDNLVKNLLSDFLLLKSLHYSIGLIGPTAVDKRTGMPYGNRLKYIQTAVINDNIYIEAQCIISTFSLVPIEVFLKVGFFLEELFIDFVEHEWCFRLKTQLGLSAFMSKRLKVQHQLGETQKLFGRTISISSPFRLYYQIRNFFWLKNLPYISTNWKKEIYKRLLLKLLYYPIVPRERLKYIQSIWNGLIDGRKDKLKRE